MLIAACVVLTVGLFLYMFSLPAHVEHTPEKTRLAFLNERKEVVYENLRDLNFEYKAGKLPEADFHAMRGSLEDEAATLLAEIDALEHAAAARLGTVAIRRSPTNA